VALARQTQGVPLGAQHMPLAGTRLLVVEDEPLIALDLIGNLKKAGALIAAAVGTTLEAMRVIDTGNFDAAVLDRNLHGQPVHELAAALARRAIPFIFVTGYRKANLPGAFQHVTTLGKPFGEQQLVDAVAALLAQHGCPQRAQT